MERFFLKDRPLMLAHRGASGHAPELTMAAFKMALEMESDGLELDVQLSKDQHLAIFHDAGLRRTTGREGLVAETSWKALQQFDAGSWFGPGFGDEKIPDLEQVLQFGPPDWRLNIELKKCPEPRRLARSVARLIRSQPQPGRIICTSFDWETLNFLAEEEPGIRLGLIFASVWPDEAWLDNWPVWSVEKSLLNPELVEKAHARGIRICAWTVNTLPEIEQQISLGVDAIITNYPDRFQTVMTNLSRRT